MTKYPKNVGSNYTVGLANPLKFSGQSLNEDIRWQVSMLSLHYTQNICNFREASILRIIIDKPADVDASETASAGSRDADDATLDWSAVSVSAPASFWAVREHRRATTVGEGIAAKSSPTLFGEIRSTKRLFCECSGTM